MTQDIGVTLGSEIIYVAGTVNGVSVTWTLTGPGTWSTTVDKSHDRRYEISITAYDAAGNSSTSEITLEYGIIGPIYDRTAADVSRAAALIAKIRDVTFAGLTAEEQLEWLAGMKAVENRTDWNRQNGNIAAGADIVRVLGYDLIAHTTLPAANADTVPTLADVNTLEGNLLAVEGCGLTMPPGWEPSRVWAQGTGPTFEDWNRWERNMAILEEVAGNIAAAWHYSGDLFSGEV